MKKDYKRYTGETIDVIFHPERCIHAAKCVKGLPKVFDVNKKPWVNVDEEEADEIANVIEQCPSGALEYTRKDRGEQEVPKDKTTIEAASNGMISSRVSIIRSRSLSRSSSPLIFLERSSNLCRLFDWFRVNFKLILFSIRDEAWSAMLAKMFP